MGNHLIALGGHGVPSGHWDHAGWAISGDYFAQALDLDTLRWRPLAVQGRRSIWEAGKEVVHWEGTQEAVSSRMAAGLVMGGIAGPGSIRILSTLDALLVWVPGGSGAASPST